jgi:SRSO17 transposase
MGCAGRVANGINTVHLAYVRCRAGHALIGARQWIPAEQLKDPVKRQVTGLPGGMLFRTKGKITIDIVKEARGDGAAFDFACDDEVDGSCTEPRKFLEGQEQAYALRVASTFMIILGDGTRLACADVVKTA